MAGKIAVITGAGSGIGLGMARAFAGAGMHVVIADIELEAAEKAARELNGTALRVDVTKPEDVAALADEVYRRFGAVHLLCNNAGVAVGGLMSDMTYDDWRWVVSVNVLGVSNCLTAFLPRMKAQDGEAHIVNTGSVAGLVSVPKMGIYAATKYAVVAMSEALRVELEPDNIGVTVVCPGSVRTRILEAHRNRPADLKDTNVAPPATFSDPVGTIDPDQMGLQIRDAVIANQMYLVPLTEDNKVFIPMIKNRFDAILEALP
nr:SDR family NAD(P)-dependent oxidoreductase [Sphingobium subterraneum]